MAAQLLCPIESPDSLSLILSKLSTRYLFSRCAQVCTIWRQVVESPIHTVVDLECRATRPQPPREWLTVRIRRGGAFERAVELCLDGHSLVGDYQLAGIGGLTRLRCLDLSSCHITDESLRRLPVGVSELSVLDFSSPSRLSLITDAGLAAIAKLPLWSLKLPQQSRITHVGYRALAPLGETLTSLVFAGSGGWCDTTIDAVALSIIGELFHRLDFLGVAGLGVRTQDRIHWTGLQASVEQGVCPPPASAAIGDSELPYDRAE